MKEVVWVAQLDTLRGLLTRQDPKPFLFFTRTANGTRKGKEFLARLEERTVDGDTPISIKSYFAQLKACRRWGKEEPHDLSKIAPPCCSRTAITTGCFRRRTPSTWPDACRTTSS